MNESLGALDGATTATRQMEIGPVETLEFQVHGTPVQQGSKKGFVVGKRAVIVDANKATLKPWRNSVRDVAETVLGGRPGFAEAVFVGIDFFMPRPKTVSRARPSVTPDIDKLTRAILDALTDSAVLKDDALVVSLRVDEWYDDDGFTGVWVNVERLS